MPYEAEVIFRVDGEIAAPAHGRVFGYTPEGCKHSSIA